MPGVAELQMEPLLLH